MVLRRNADILKLAAVELDPWISKELLQEKTTKNMAYGKPIRFGGFVHMVRRNHAPGAVHVLDNNRRITWNVLSHLARDDPRIKIIAATWGEPDNQADRLTLIKGFLGVSGNSPYCQAKQSTNRQQRNYSSCTHMVPLIGPKIFCALLSQQFLHPFDDVRWLDHHLFDECVHFLAAAWVYL